MEASLTKEGLSINYDEDADILYISLGRPQPAISVEVNDGNLMRVDPFTDELVGITVLDFKERHLERGNEKSSYNGGRR